METRSLARFLRKAIQRSRFIGKDEYITLFGDPLFGKAVYAALENQWELMRSDFQTWFLCLEEEEACKFVEWINADRRGSF